MTTQTSIPETLSSQTGRSCLENTQASIPGYAKLTDLETEPQPQSILGNVKTVEVSLPDVSGTGRGETGYDLSQTIHPTIVAKLLSGTPVDEELANDISETPAQWGNQSVDRPANRDTRVEETKPSKSRGLDAEVDRLCDAILERFPLGDPSVLLFVGAEANNHIDEASARIAARLADRNIGRVLLLDSDLREQALTYASGLSKSHGISDVTNQGKDWKSLIYTGDVKSLDFMPGGTHEGFRHPEEKSRLRAAVTEMKQDYQFVLVSAGDAHGSSAKVWNDICDGSYLLVSMKNSNETYAQSAVAQLQASGSRLLGCVLTDND